MTNAMQQLHSQANESLARRLHDAMRNLRSGSGGISTAIQEAARGNVVSPDAPQIAGQGSDIASTQNAGAGGE